MNDFASIIAMWPAPSIRAFADDIGVEYGTAQIWKHRNSIPDPYWDLVVQAAVARGFPGITLETLQQISARRRRARGNGRSHSVAA